MNKIRKLRSKTYPQVIEVQVPVRFYWNEEEYDGFEFGPLEGCTRHQLRLLDNVVDELSYQTHCAKFFEYMKEHHKVELEVIMDHMNADDLGIPQTFIDAFKDSDLGKPRN